jgi:hypothetical protein
VFSVYVLWLDLDRNRIHIGLKSERREPHRRRHSRPDDWINRPLHDPAKGLNKTVSVALCIRGDTMS